MYSMVIKYFCVYFYIIQINKNIAHINSYAHNIQQTLKCAIQGPRNFAQRIQIILLTLYFLLRNRNQITLVIRVAALGLEIVLVVHNITDSYKNCPTLIIPDNNVLSYQCKHFCFKCCYLLSEMSDVTGNERLIKTCLPRGALINFNTNDYYKVTAFEYKNSHYESTIIFRLRHYLSLTCCFASFNQWLHLTKMCK